MRHASQSKGDGMKKLIWIVLLCWLAGCESNPYPDSAHLVPPDLKHAGPVQKTYSLTGPFSVTCNEGVACSFQIQFSVTNDQPVLAFENLPTGATADTTVGTVKWTPPHPQTDGQGFVVLVDLKGAGDDSIQRQIAVVIIVKVAPAQAPAPVPTMVPSPVPTSVPTP